MKDLPNLEGGNFEASRDTFKKMVDKFERSKKRNYDFLTKAGTGFQETVFKLDGVGPVDNRLNSLQQWFLPLVLQVGPGATLTSLLWDFHCWDMGLQVDREKLMLALHCRRLGKDALAG